MVAINSIASSDQYLIEGPRRSDESKYMLRMPSDELPPMDNSYRHHNPHTTSGVSIPEDCGFILPVSRLSTYGNLMPILQAQGNAQTEAYDDEGPGDNTRLATTA
ncbi:hypothetical protein GLAREA_12576 [Glarea lozoyensis ATCC 20868]|uniref:Uncharacterized protein n=1 Tax=Glarea lozoyensis (strain ATCC 20868 / MF5171) TaxID=1116229 RepID=S3DY67_GLAL2|nr:uncharacterized protein GLAREA_12576 [Glarea lozoyensis ATCC 20868]EPE31273.1 hypothetical protein GLAREA_12576 [Glarea lozoyensis ATCC 20868]